MRIYRDTGLRFRLLIVAAATCLAGGGTAMAEWRMEAIKRPPPIASKTEFRDWAAQRAIPVERWEMNDALEAYLDRALYGKRIVYIGEPDHFFHEKIDVQVMLIRYLMSKGYLHILHEGLGTSMARHCDRWIATGEMPAEMSPDSWDRTRLLRYMESTCDAFPGLKTEEFKRRHRGERRRFYEALHEMNRKRPEGTVPLRIHPFDLDFLPGGCYETIDSLLERPSDSSALMAARKAAACVKDESVAEELIRLDGLRTCISNVDLSSVLGKEDARRLRESVDCLIASISFFETCRGPGGPRLAMIEREPFMFKQAVRTLDSLPDGAKVIVLAHNNHLCKESRTHQYANGTSAGERLSREYPGKVFSIWMLYDHGWHLDRTDATKGIGYIESEPHRVESVLASVGATFCLPFGAGDGGGSYLSAERTIQAFGYDHRTVLSRQTDAVFFLDEVSAMRELG